MSTAHRPPILGLFQKRIEGDDSLLELARMRFEQAGLGSEMYAGHPDELEHLLQFRPANDMPVVVHLSRGINMLDPNSRARVLEFARRFAGRVMGMVIHDQRETVLQAEDYRRGVRELDAQLDGTPDSPWLFIEYAVGLEPDDFAKLAEDIAACRRTSVCIDVSHVGIRQARAAFAETHPGRDACDYKPHHPELPALAGDIQAAVATALPTVRKLIQRTGALGKPIHFHLHDGHPASTFSPYGVSDHLSFFATIPLPFEHDGRNSLPTLFGPGGLQEIIDTALESAGPRDCSFTLEIHQPQGRRPLEDAEPLFGHWRDKTNAEHMNHWMAVLRENQQPILEAFAKHPALRSDPG